ncbi:MAG: hypothetical protein AAFX99_31705, partial [Myxococcota bacterium]
IEVNSNTCAFMAYRPDYIVEDFQPCFVTNAKSGNIDDIKDAIIRKAHVFEFTSIKEFNIKKVRDYLDTKLPNYVEITAEQ